MTTKIIPTDERQSTTHATPIDDVILCTSMRCARHFPHSRHDTQVDRTSSTTHAQIINGKAHVTHSLTHSPSVYSSRQSTNVMRVCSTLITLCVLCVVLCCVVLCVVPLFFSLFLCCVARCPSADSTGIRTSRKQTKTSPYKIETTKQTGKEKGERCRKHSGESSWERMCHMGVIESIFKHVHVYRVTRSISSSPSHTNDAILFSSSSLCV